MKEKNKKEKNKKEKITHMRTMKNCRFIAVAATVFVGILLSLAILNCSLSIVVQEYEDDMVQGLKDIVRQYSDDVLKDELYDESANQTAEEIAGYIKTLFMRNGVNEYMLDYVDSYVSDYVNYYLFCGELDHDKKQANGYFIYQETRQQLKNYSKEELYKILTRKKVMSKDGYRIYSYDMNPGQYLIIRFAATEIFTKKSALEAYSEDSDELICRIDTQTGIIEDSSEVEYLGTSVDEYSVYEGRKSYRNLKPYEPLVMVNSRGQTVIFAKSDEINGDMFVSVIPTNILLPAVVRNSIMGIVLCWVFLIIILKYVLKFLKNIYDEEKSVKFIPITKKLCIDVHFFSHVGGLTVFAALLTTVSMLYVQTMTNYSTQNEKARIDLKGLEQHIELNEENSVSMEEDYFANAYSVLEILSAYLSAFPEDCSNETLGEFADNFPTIDRITLYNSDGVAEYDSDGIVGVALSRDSMSGESLFWKVINGESSYEYFETKSEDTLFFDIAIRRLDSKGIICIRQNGECLEKFREKSSVQNYVLTANMGVSERGYIEKETPDTLYWAKAGGTKFKEYPNTLSDEVLKHGYSGMVRINNNRQLVNVRDTDDRILICGKSTYRLFGLMSVVEYLLVIVLMGVQYLILAVLCTKRRKDVESDEINVVGDKLSYQEIFRERTMDSEYRKTAVWMLMCAIFMIVVTLVVDSCFGSTSILSYLFGSRWTKGINLFSITMIMMLIATVVLFSKLFEVLVLFFTKNMGPRGVTLGKMFCSLIKFVALVIVTVMTLVYLGADLTALLASAGIAGAMISFCAQQTVNDLLSGLFIIFENSVNVGDWVEVDGFRGEVIEIGVRVTKISAGGEVVIVNNSDLRNISKMNKEKSGALCEFEIAYKEDATAVMELLRNKAQYMKDMIPQIEEGPYLEGVLELGSSGILLRMWALGHRDDTLIIERELLRITKEILDENNIEIPFTQITVHTSDVKQ